MAYQVLKQENQAEFRVIGTPINNYKPALKKYPRQSKFI